MLGFDYGYSLDYPNMLCLWEAQFGDFANGAQTIIDQFIVSAESKWQRPSGIVLLLPHGYEGQGPEHSSARLERFLQACAEDNIQVCNLTTAAQYFHVLRRQMKRDFIKPLIIMTPKSLLRSEQAASRTEDFTSGKFLGNPAARRKWRRRRKSSASSFAPAKSTTISSTTGRRRKSPAPRSLGWNSSIRWRRRSCAPSLEPFGKAQKFVWCQEESQNMGAWTYIEPRLRALLGREILYAGRNASASPAVGALALHKREQACVINDAFTLH